MAATENETKFKFVGGHPTVDFVNTVGGWVSNPAKTSTRDYGDLSYGEKLTNYFELVTWIRQAGLISEKDGKQLSRAAETHPRIADAVLKRSYKLRNALYRLFKATIEKWRSEETDLACLNEELQIARKHQSLVSSGNKINWDWDNSNEALDRVLWPLALSGAELLTSGDLSRLRQCGGQRCGWMFLDTSRNRSRHWCKMSDCGNLEKVRRFRRRLTKASAR